MQNYNKFEIKHFLDHYKKEQEQFQIPKIIFIWSQLVKSWFMRGKSEWQYQFELDREDLNYLFEKYSRKYIQLEEEWKKEEIRLLEKQQRENQERLNKLKQ